METLLMIVTLVSVALAVGMSVLAWRLLREDRRRAAARADALEAMAAEGDEPASGTRHSAQGTGEISYTDDEANVVPVKLAALPGSYQPVMALALSADGKRLAVGRGGSIVVHDASQTNFPVVAQFEAHRDAVQALAWSPDRH